MPLLWVRLDTTIPGHDKILALVDEKPTGIAYQAAFSYVCSIAYSGFHETDGLIPFAALKLVHGNQKTALLLVKHELWKPDQRGWTFAKWTDRQPSAALGQQVRNVRRAAGTKGNCIRWHGPDCHCWKDSE